MAGSIGNVETHFFTHTAADGPMEWHCASGLEQFTQAYETYGELNDDASNAILVFHALTGSQHAAGYNPSIPEAGDLWQSEYHTGWWDGFIGSGKAFDTDRYFVICANYLGGCYGSTGPSSIDPAAGKRYGSSFPDVCFADMVDAQMKLLDHLGVDRLRAVTGGSTGGIMAVSLASRYPDRVELVLPIASGIQPTSLQILHNFEQTVAIQSDPNFAGGDYYDGPIPKVGVMLARMISHKTFVSLKDLNLRARDEVVQPSQRPGAHRLGHPLESYIWHQAAKFVMRFDANTYLRIMKAWTSYDLAAEADVDGLEEVLRRSKNHRYLLFSIDSDVCFYNEEQADLVRYLELAEVDHRWITVHSDKGHDSFLLEPELYAPHIQAILNEEW